MEKILVLDFGGRHNQIIARRVRAQQVYAEIRAGFKVTTDAKSEYGGLTLNEIREGDYKGIILTGSPGFQNNLPKAMDDVLKLNIPVLEINGSELEGEDEGEQFFREFLFSSCGCKGDWILEKFAAESIEKYRAEYANKKVLLALSGGVDSSVCAAMLSKAIGKNLSCVFVDHGLMRKNEPDEIEQLFTQKFDLNFIHVHAKNRYLAKLKGITDPEKKRKIIGEEFIRIFEEEAKNIGQIDVLAQGTIYPDVIESGVGEQKAIKSHHNVGGLPERLGFDLILEPLRDLFKDEVRKIGLTLGLPEALVWRQPFPGPGLGVRCIGEITAEKLDILRDADAIFREEIRNAGLEFKFSQYFAIVTDVQSVGVRGEERSYERMVVLRSVDTGDFMTADWSRVPYELLAKASNRIIAEVHGVNRVVYDITAKPPGTVEWE